jgi:hypothetical protein
VPIVLKSGSLNLLEPSGPVKACNGIAVPVLCVLFVCKCVMYCCHRVSAQLRLNKYVNKYKKYHIKCVCVCVISCVWDVLILSLMLVCADRDVDTWRCVKYTQVVLDSIMIGIQLARCLPAVQITQ